MSKVKLLASLEETVQAWIDESCMDEAAWPPNLVIGEYTAFHMAKAAYSVLCAMDDAQTYGEREGLF